MKIKEKLAPILSLMRKTAGLWVYYALIPVVILALWLIRTLLFPELPAAVAFLAVDVLLILSVRWLCKLWQDRKQIFTPEEEAHTFPLFMLIPAQIVFIVVSAVMVLP